MCDELTADDNDRFLSRRDFGAVTGAVGLAMMLPAPANARSIAGRDVTIETPDGRCDAYFVAPSGVRSPAVLVWPDIMGLRPAFRKMADRLAQSGYAVLTVNQFYRSTKAPFLAAGESFDQPAVRDRIGPWRAELTPAATTRDATAFLTWIDKQREVDTRRGIGSTGYCMGGPMTFRTAAANPTRVGAIGAFHPAGLVTDTPDSPHLLVPRMRAAALIAIAGNDDARSPNDKTALRSAFASAKRPAEVEVYAGTMHGWCPPDSRVYNHAEAERAWARQLVTLQRL